MKKIRKHARKIALMFVTIQAIELILPMRTFALTGGPTTPEVQSASASDEQQMVNLFTGDFSYNIPLMDVGGYPISISYNSDAVKMESEATQVGLGWNLDVGTISREVRGLADDFSGDIVAKEMNKKPEEESGVKLGFGIEFTGFDAAKIGAEAGMEISKNNYDGWEVGMSTSAAGSASTTCGDGELSGSLSAGLGVSNKGGASYNADLSFDGELTAGHNKAKMGVGIGLDAESREGIKALDINAGFSGGWSNKLPHGKVTRQLSKGFKSNFPISFASAAFSPTFKMPQNSEAYLLSFKLGGEISNIALSGNVSGHYSKSYLASNRDSVPAFGYIYSDKSSGGRELLDFNRDNDGAFISELPNLPVTQFTHDVYSVSGQGIGGSFRPFRGDVGMLHDAYSYQNNTQVKVGGEVGLGNLVKVGVDVVGVYTHSESKKWQEGNGFVEPLGFKSSTNNVLYEPVYFKNLSEVTAMANTNQYLNIGRDHAICAGVNNDGTTKGNLLLGNNEMNFTNENFVKRNREPRNTMFAYLNANDAVTNGFEKEIKTYKPNISPLVADAASTTSSNAPRKIQRNSRYRKNNHLSEITVTRTDGARFIYGIPAYNISSKDVSFNISGEDTAGRTIKPDGKKMVSYMPGLDNTVANNRGVDNFFEAETTPAYAYAWLLSSVLSDDYVDLTGNGPTPDDLGNYTKFNYTQNSLAYPWRMPVEKNKAFYQEGNKSDEEDNMAHYSYGLKEIWNVHSIETRNYVAEFSYSLREDGLGVVNENGGKNPFARLMKLDCITLYAKSERLQKGNAAVPLKKVNFSYDYSLCKGISNSISDNGGKLTLKQISFTYGSSEKGKLSPYNFSYSENPNYSPKKIDRWGNYLKKSDDDEGGSYSALKKDSADKYAAAWLLDSIKTPEGSGIKIKYETDDYAFVQNKTAMEMYTTQAFTSMDRRNDTPSDNDSVLYAYREVPTHPSVNNFLKIKLKKPTTDPEELRKYFDDIHELYFSATMTLTKAGVPPANEKVEGFIPVSFNTFNIDYGFCTGTSTPSGFTYAWLKIPKQTNGDGNAEDENGVHPFAKAAWQKIRKSMPEMIYNTSATIKDDAMLFAQAAADAVEALGEFFSDPNTYFKKRDQANRICLSKSKIRLCSPDRIKFGGGARVKKIMVTDGWAEMSGVAGTTSTYGTEYFYTTKENISGRETTISSGVASYEPPTGGEENPFALPTRYSIEKPLAIDLALYQTEPVGEAFFPGAGIGYSKVKVRNLQHENVTKNATGFSVSEFYTAKDFPTITSQTLIQINPKEVPFPPFYSEKQATVSQGFCIDLNNMHGQQKAVHVFQQTDSVNPISGQQFFYKTNAQGNLENNVNLVDGATGIISQNLLGVDYEFYSDARECFQETHSGGADINVDVFIAGPAPLITPSGYPDLSYALKRYRGITFTKVIHRSGILERVESYNNGASASAATTLYDKQTGEGILSEAKNEFDSTEYSLNIPAYWVNGGMDAAYKNCGVKMTITLPIGGGYENVFSVGDELHIRNFRSSVPEFIPGLFGRTVVAPPKKVWVFAVNSFGVSLIDEKGNAVAEPGNYDIEITRSGRKNRLNELAGSVSSLANPVAGNRLQIPSRRIVNATASEYSNLWQTYAAFTATQPQYQCNCEQYGNKVGKTAKDFMQPFLQTLLTNGDFKRTGISLQTSPYTDFVSFLQNTIGMEPRIFNGIKNGTQIDGQIINADSSSCNIKIEMADHRSTFPETILGFTLDLTQTDSTDRAECDDVYTALGTIIYPGGLSTNITHGGQTTATARVRVTTSCFPFLLCHENYVGRGELTCAPSGSGVVNPFINGILGSWRKKSDYTYRSEREGNAVATGGTLAGEFRSFFSNTFPLSVSARAENSPWQYETAATVFDPYGRNMESKNSVGIYSSEVFGYGFSLPILAAQNARYMNTAFDGFEDYQYKNEADNPWNNCPILPHFKFDTASAKVVDNVSHTGYSSLKVTDAVSLTRNFYALEDAVAPSGSSSVFTATRNNLIQPFTPNEGKYFFSAWMRTEAPAPSDTAGGGTHVFQNIGNLINNISPINFSGLGSTFTGLTGAMGDVKIKITNSSGAETTLAAVSREGKSIDGWKQINAEFTILENVRSIKVELSPPGVTAWYDDIRIQPFNSQMKTFVYDPQTLRLMATLDENNYAAMYEYDNEGNLVRNKKEVEDNIVTLQEIRSAKPKTR